MTTIHPLDDVRHITARNIGDALTHLQTLVGAANARKGFHEEGERIRQAVKRAQKQLDAAFTYEDENPGDANGLFTRELRQDELEEALAALRNYETARIALMITEGAEAIEDLRSGRRSDETWYTAKIGGNTYAWAAGEKPDALDASVIGKPEGVPSEIADIVIRSFDFAHEAGFDLAAIIAEKLAYNATRAHKHGRKF